MNNTAEKNIGLNGAYQQDDVIWHQHSNKLLVELLNHFTKEVPIIDLGCGHNWYANTLKVLGYRAIGVDNAWYPSLDARVDITIPIKPFIQVPIINSIPEKWNVLSLEVGEHIPSELAAGYLDNVCSFGGDVCMSWAVKGQPGIGHINCQDNFWVISEMNNRGYAIDHIKTACLRHAVRDCHCSWFTNTLMYFTKQ